MENNQAQAQPIIPTKENTILDLGGTFLQGTLDLIWQSKYFIVIVLLILYFINKKYGK